MAILCLGLGAAAWGDQSASFAWDPDPAPSVAGYNLYRGTNSGNYYIKTDVGTNTVVTLTGLKDGQTNYFVVKAYNQSRIESPPSNEAKLVVPTAAPPVSAPAPQISVVNPASGLVGTQVFIYGTNFTATTRVQFGGVNAAFVVNADTLLVATVPNGAVSGQLTITTSAGTATGQFAVLTVAPPANDNFAQAQTITGSAAIVSANLTGATKQPGEAGHAGNAGGHSVWFRWTAPISGTWGLDTSGSDFTPLLAVYTGSSVSNLMLVAGNNTSAGVLTNALSFNATAGVTYQFAMDGPGGVVENVVLSLGQLTLSSTLVSNAFEAAAGFTNLLSLAGQNGWQSVGTAASGLKNNLFPGLGQQAFIGFGSTTPATSSRVFVPINYAAVGSSRPLVQFSVTMQVTTLAYLFNSMFTWQVDNMAGHEMFRVIFDDSAKTISYALDNGAGPVGTGLSFNNESVCTFAMSLDFSRNRWSATVNGTPLATEQPITTTGAALNLGDIAAGEVFQSASLPGMDAMLFDNYLVTASTGPLPTITLGLQNASVATGGSVMLGVIASGGQPLGYQWYFNSNLIYNASYPNLLLTGVTSNQTGNYSVRVSNAYGSATSAAVVSLSNPSAQVAQVMPLAMSRSIGAALSFNVKPANNYRFQASTNLVNWVTLGTFFASSTNALCLDPAAGNYSRRFYRLVTP